MTDQPPPSGTARRARFLLPASLVLLVAAACSPAPGGTPGPSAGPSSGPTAQPTPTAIAGIEHPTGATAIVLRVESSGGLVPVEFLATSAPSFTLYGDGTVVFRDDQATPPDAVGSVVRSVPFQTIKLDEAGIQALLELALGPGGIGIATGPYMCNCADMPSTNFTVNADGRMKTVSVTGLSPDMHQPQDQLIVGSLARLAERLRTFGQDVAGEVVYEPAAYRGVLQKVDQANGPVVDWPWTEVAPTDFVSDANGFLLTHTLTPAQVATLSIPGAQGGMLGLNLQKDGALYSLALRPLLPDETS
ncbi:MAG TPA: hypothetical protein VL749_06960 [Patescibacteria group bacterium]|nr:hypothetical protein [Patescibacteria group bacterium]